MHGIPTTITMTRFTGRSSSASEASSLVRSLSPRSVAVSFGRFRLIIAWPPGTSRVVPPHRWHRPSWSRNGLATALWSINTRKRGEGKTTLSGANLPASGLMPQGDDGFRSEPAGNARALASLVVVRAANPVLILPIIETRFWPRCQRAAVADAPSSFAPQRSHTAEAPVRLTPCPVSLAELFPRRTTCYGFPGGYCQTPMRIGIQCGSPSSRTRTSTPG